MSAALNNVTTADRYTSANTLTCPGGQRLTIHARNASIYYQLGDGWPATDWHLDEVFMPPGTMSGARDFDAVRVRSATPGQPAQVTIDAGAESLQSSPDG